MRFRRFIIPLLLILITMFSWNLACTWKKNQLQDEAQQYLEQYKGQYIAYEQIEDYLSNRYNTDRPIWDLPFLGKITYDKLKKHTVSKGPDTLGGRTTTLTVDEHDFLLRHANREADMLKTFKKALSNTDEAYKEHSRISYIQTFIEQLKQEAKVKEVGAYFDFTDTSSPLSNSAVESRLQTEMKKTLEKAAPILQKRLDPDGQQNYGLYVDKDGHTLTVNIPKTAEDDQLKKYTENPGTLTFGKALIGKETKTIADEIAEDLRINHSIFQLQRMDNNNTGCFMSKKDYEQYGERIKLAASDYLPTHQQLFLYETEQEWIQVLIVEMSTKQNFRVEEASKKEVTGVQNRMDHGKWQIQFKLDEPSHRELASIIREITGLDNQTYTKRLPIILNNKVLIAPTIKNPISEKGDRTQNITGIKSSEEAKDIVLQMTSGALDCKLKQVSSFATEPSLSKKSQDQAFSAIKIALLLILLFVFLYYAVAGLVANASLMLNLIFILGTLARFQANLTLTSLAGIVLTIGMAIDTNVLVFERILEELRRGATKKNAIRNGYQKAYRSIIDSSITTLITGIILAWNGGPDVQGFANTLIIGIISTFITGVLCSQIIIEGLMRLLGEKRISFSFGFSAGFLKKTNINFLGKRKYTYLFSLLFIGGGMALTYHQGLDLGIGFTGGKEYIIRSGKKMNNEDLKGIKQHLQTAFEGVGTAQGRHRSSLEVLAISQASQERGSSYRVTTNFGIDNDIDVDKLVQESIATTSGSTYKVFGEGGEKRLRDDEFTFEAQNNIGTSIARKYAQKAIWAVLLALLLMLIYIFFSFRNLGLAIAALVALVHDALALFTCLSIAKLFGVTYAIDPIFITTLLTIIGYSINDTCVIFNHIREHMKAENTHNIQKVANTAVNKTLSRTLITSLTTFIPVFTLYCFAGAALELLAFSLLWGILWGTYSSVFLATPIACDLDKLFKKITKNNKGSKAAPAPQTKKHK